MFFQQMWYKWYIKHSTKKGRKNGKVAHHRRTNDVFKNIRSQRHEDYCGFVKSRVGPRMLGVTRGRRSLVAFQAKMVVKRCLFENHENRKWHPKPTFHNRSALGPSKNGPGERFWKNIKHLWKNDRTINGFWWSKTIENFWKTNTFLDFRSFKKTMKNRCQSGSQKSWKMIQNGARGRPGSIYSLFLLIFGEGEKTWFFDEVLGRPKNVKSTRGAPNGCKNVPGRNLGDGRQGGVLALAAKD